MISEVILRYHPDWDPPADIAEWNRCLCPFHGDETPSAAVSYDLQGFNCMACGVRGDALSIIQHEEEVNFAEAVRISESLSVGSDNPVQRKPSRKPGRRLFGEPRDARRVDKAVRPRVRRRPSPWA